MKFRTPFFMFACWNRENKTLQNAVSPKSRNYSTNEVFCVKLTYNECRCHQATKYIDQLIEYLFYSIMFDVDWRWPPQFIKHWKINKNLKILVVCKTVLDSGFHAVDSVTFFVSGILDSRFQSLVGFWIRYAVFQIQSPGFRTPDSTSKFWNPGNWICRIPESVFPYTGATRRLVYIKQE